MIPKGVMVYKLRTTGTEGTTDTNVEKLLYMEMGVLSNDSKPYILGISKRIF